MQDVLVVLADHGITHDKKEVRLAHCFKVRLSEKVGKHFQGSALRLSIDQSNCRTCYVCILKKGKRERRK